MNDVSLATGELRDLAFKLYEELEKSVQQSGLLYIKVGKILKTIHDQELYKYLGDGGLDSFESFIAQSKLRSIATARLYIKVYEYFIEKMGMTVEEVSQIPLNRLQLVVYTAKTIDNDKEERELIEKAKVLSTTDLKDEIRIIKPHLLERPEVYMCDVCHRWIIKYKSEDMCMCNGTIALIKKE